MGPRLPSLPLSSLKDAVVGIDATYYLNQRLNKQSQEPLLNALGGFPFVLKSSIEHELSILKNHGVTPLFVFSGLEFSGRSRESSTATTASTRAYEQAWQAYDDGDPQQVLEGFQQAGKFSGRLNCANKV